MLGIGGSWTLSDSSFVELSYFQKTQPEKLSLGTHMTASGTVTLVTLVPLYYLFANILRSRKQAVPYRSLIYLLFLINIVTTLIGSLFWEYTVYDQSVVILLVAFMGNFVGNLQTAAIVPWVSSQIDNRLISTVLAGGNFGSLLSAAVGFVQSPGKGPDGALFDPTIYWFIINGFLILSLLSFVYIDRHYLDRSSKTGIMLPNDEFSHTGIDNNYNEAGGSGTGGGGGGTKSSRKKSVSEKQLTQLSGSFMGSNLHEYGTNYNDDDGNDDNMNEHTYGYDSCRYICKSIKGTLSLPSYWREVWQYAAMYSWIQIVTWNLMQSILPFAAAHVAKGTGEGILQYAFELSYVALFTGSAISIFLHAVTYSMFVVILTIFFLITVVFLIISVDNSGFWTFSGGNILVICLAFGIRLFYGFLLPVIFRYVGENHDSKSSEQMTRWIAAVEKVATFISVWATVVLVEEGYISA